VNKHNNSANLQFYNLLNFEGVISIKGHYPSCDDVNYADFLAIGPMTRYSRDLKLMMRVMTSDDVVLGLRLEEKVEDKTERRI
jgi:Asp-tRNA(Asn)/Glu-tRNA(Gln) amidotransferase A subunit family amidase